MSFTSPVTPGPITCSQKLWPTCPLELPMPLGDRKSTRLNSSHDQISYAVFCLKKKNKLEKVGEVEDAPEVVDALPGLAHPKAGLDNSGTEVATLVGRDDTTLALSQHRTHDTLT